MKLAELLAEVDVVASSAPVGLEVRGVACDSRLVRRGDVFVVIRGNRDDGFRYVEQALARGAAAIVADLPPPPSGPPWVQLADVRYGLAQMSAAAHGHPSHQMALYGVTGTNGKTSVAGLLRDLLQRYGRRTGLISTVEYSYGERRIASTRTTPDSCELQELLAAMRSDGCQAVAMEVSSHALDQHRTGACRFAGAAFTNLTRDHFDYHGGFTEYFEAKRRLFMQLAEHSPGAPAVLNLDDPYGVRLADEARELGLSTITFGIENSHANVSAHGLELASGATRFELRTPMGAARIDSHLLGRFSVSNMLCVAGFAVGLDISLDSMRSVLEEARPRWGRLEKVEARHAATIFVDYAHTADALRNVLGTLRELAPRRLIVVFGCGGDRDRAKRPAMGRVATELADCVIVTSDNPRSENPQDIIDEIMEGVGGVESHIEPDRRDAIALALRISGKGDIVLVAGKGHETYQETSHHRTSFDDREVVRRLAESES